MYKLPKKQSGIALLVSLILLLLLTIVAVTASNTASLQERAALNAQQQNSAFQTAESALDAITNSISPNNTNALNLQTDYNTDTDKGTNSFATVSRTEELGNTLDDKRKVYIFTYRGCGSALPKNELTITDCPENNASVQAGVTAKHAQGYRIQILSN